ncbi:MAG: hypothetical protein E3J72_04160 [Planctomycetota bacterium]|nr:MAG: hypothetical protein E3J72_04160 [Planctomycetota bacterium]
MDKDGSDHDKHGEHKKELWKAFKDESMPKDERIQKLEELKGVLTRKIEKIETTIAELKS